MIDAAESYLTDHQFASLALEIKAFDLHYLNPEIKGLNIGDQIRVISHPHGVNRDFMLTKLSIPLDKPENAQFTLGSTEQMTLTSMSSAKSSALEKKIADTTNTSKVYLDNKYFGEYSLWYDDSKWYAFKSDKSAVIMEGDLLAYSSNFDLDIKEFEIKENTNNTYVHQVLAKNELPTSSQMTINSVVKVDIDNDGIEEEIYTISNAFASDFYPDKLFSIAFMVKDEQIYSMYTNIEEASFGNGCKPYVRAILDINEDKTYEVILTCGKFSIQKQEDMLFKLNKEKFDLLISNQ